MIYKILLLAGVVYFLFFFGRGKRQTTSRGATNILLGLIVLLLAITVATILLKD